MALQDSAVVWHIVLCAPQFLSTVLCLGVFNVLRKNDFLPFLIFFYILHHIVQPEIIVWNNTFCLRPRGKYCMSLNTVLAQVCVVVKSLEMFVWGTLSFVIIFCRLLTLPALTSPVVTLCFIFSDLDDLKSFWSWCNTAILTGKGCDAFEFTRLIVFNAATNLLIAEFYTLP